MTSEFKEYVDDVGRCLMIRTNARRLSCCICDKVFKTKTQCLQHLSVSHRVKLKKFGESLNPLTKCDHCDKYFSSRKNLSEHMCLFHKDLKVSKKRVLKPKSVSCPVCSKAFVTLGGVNRHLRISHGDSTESDQDSSNTVPCHFCALKFKLQPDCLSHMEIYHHVVFVSKEKENGVKEEFYRCSLCNIESIGLPVIKKHFLEEHDENISENNIEVTSEVEEGPASDEIFNCDGCHLSFKYEEDWSSHMKNEHNAFPESCCRRCGDHSSRTIYDLKCHMRDVHCSITTDGLTHKRIRQNGSCKLKNKCN